LIPAMSPKGEVSNLVRWLPARGNQRTRKFNLPGLPVGLFGLDQLSDDLTKHLLVCEGPFDLIALDQHLRSYKVRGRYDLLAVPGAWGFKPEWAKFFASRKVRLLYDNDEAGQKGQERAAKLIGAVANEVFTLSWPSKYPKGCDISDIIRDGIGVIDFANTNCIKVEAGSKRLQFIRGDAIERERVEWLWDGRLQFGTFVSFAGLMGTHKSGIVRDLVARATAGLPMPYCKHALPPMDVLYFTSEDAADKICDLVKIAGGDLTRLHVYDIATVCDPVDILVHLEEIEATFVGGDISTDAKARRTLSGRLQQLARRTGACVIGIRNWNRSDSGTSSQRALGATSLSDVARCVLNTRELPPIDASDKTEPRRFSLDFEKVSNAPKPESIEFHVKNLSTGPDDSHLRKIVWVQSAEDFRAGLKQGREKVAKKGSVTSRSHLTATGKGLRGEG
jgi:hypothetical protein